MPHTHMRAGSQVTSVWISQVLPGDCLPSDTQMPSSKVVTCCFIELSTPCPGGKETGRRRKIQKPTEDMKLVEGPENEVGQQVLPGMFTLSQ